MNAKKFVFSIIALLILFTAGNMAIWNTLKTADTEADARYHHGDFCRLGIYGDLFRMYRYNRSASLTEQKEYSNQHIILYNYLMEGRTDKIDVLTIGDSFTNGGGGNYYQDYMQEISGLTFVNCAVGIYNPIEILDMLDKYGIIDKLQPKVIVMESCARLVPNRFDTDKIETPKLTYDELVHQMNKSRTSWEAKHDFDWLNSDMVAGNERWISSLYEAYKYKKENSEKMTNIISLNTLNSDCFTDPGNERKLLFSDYDTEYTRRNINYERINQRINEAADKMAAKGIKVMFMIATDKHDLYFNYIDDEHNVGRPENPLFDIMEKMPDKRYTFINTKRPLRKELEKGTKDIYWADDSHWSWIGIEAVCNDMLPYFKNI